MNLQQSKSAISTPRWYLAGLLIVLIVANGIRHFRLTEDDLSSREGYSIALASMPPNQLFQHIHQNEISPSLYPVILREWYSFGKYLHHLFDTKELKKYPVKSKLFTMSAPWSKSSWEWLLIPDVYWGRFLSLLFGLGTIILIFCIGRHIRDDWVGLTSAILLTFFPSHIRISREITPLTLQMFFLLGAFLCFLKALNESNDEQLLKNQRILPILGCLLLGVLSITIEISSLIFLVVLLLWYLLSHQKNTLILVASMMIFIFALSWEYYWGFPINSYSTVSNFEVFTKWKDFGLAQGFLDVPIFKPGYFKLFCSIILAVCLISGIICSRINKTKDKKYNPAHFLLFSLLIGIIGLFTICNLILGDNSGFMGITLIAPVLCLLLASGFRCFSVPNWSYRFIVLLIILDLSFLHSLYFDHPYIRVREIAKWLDNRMGTADQVMVLPSNQSYAFDYYFQKPGLRKRFDSLEDVESWTPNSENDISRVWVVKLSDNTVSPAEYKLMQHVNNLSNNHYVNYVIWKPELLTVTCYEFDNNIENK